MTQLQFDKTTKFRISNLNVRDEIRGKDHTPAIDLAVTCTTSNLLLEQIEPGLVSMFYMEAEDANPDAPELDGVERISSFPKLRTTLVRQIKIDKEYVGYDFSIITGTGTFALGDLKFNKITVNLLEGGSVNWTFRLQASGVDDATIGRFGVLINHWIEGTLTISESAQATIAEAAAAGNVVPIKGEKKPEPEKTATDLFVEGAAAEKAP